MKISELPNCPDWLRNAKTTKANVEWNSSHTQIIWRGGEWRGGEWRGGVWRGGVWCDGVWCDGVWRDGVRRGGEWRGGVWCGGEWRGGVWRGGVWNGHELRLLYMAACLGIVEDPATKTMIGYRTTQRDGKGRFTHSFIQQEGPYYEADIPQSGSGTCTKGIHVTSAARAWTYFRVDPTCQFWKVKFKKEDLLDCDGEKCRIRGGVFTKIPRPF